MTVDPLTLATAIVVPIVALTAFIGLVRAVSDLERARDEMIEAGATGR
jgi:hypothetical protein